MSYKKEIESFLISQGCKRDLIGFYNWFTAPNGHRFSVDIRDRDFLIINHKEPTGKNRDFCEPLTTPNLLAIAEGFILWMLTEDSK